MLVRTLLLSLSVGILLSEVVCADLTRAPMPQVTTAHHVVVETVAEGLEHPWALQFLPDGRMLVSERAGRLRVVARNGTISEPIVGVPPVFATGQGGLLDIALDPKFGENGRLFFSFSEPRGSGSNGTSVAQARLSLETNTGRLLDVRTVFRQIPATTGGLHFGSRLAFAGDGRLFITLGERYQRDRAQELGNHYGKVVRIETTGEVPADNPYVSQSSILPEIWSYGHRNPQAAAINPTTGKLWTVEHGARGGDEVNISEPGRNYGWPVITYGIDYSGSRIGEGTAKAGMEQPIYYWDPSIAPSGMVFYQSKRFPEWTGNLFVGALAGQHLSRLILRGDTVVGEEKLLGDFGERIRDVREGPDGALYVLTDHPRARILRLTLGSQSAR